jgi:hypothetical protein
LGTAKSRLVVLLLLSVLCFGFESFVGLEVVFVVIERGRLIASLLMLAFTIALNATPDFFDL